MHKYLKIALFSVLLLAAALAAHLALPSNTPLALPAPPPSRQHLLLAPLDSRLEEYLKFKLGRLGKPLSEVIDASGVEALRAKLTISTNRRDRRDTVSLLYPLAVGNLLTACMNLAADIGVPTVNADVVREV